MWLWLELELILIVYVLSFELISSNVFPRLANNFSSP